MDKVQKILAVKGMSAKQKLAFHSRQDESGCILWTSAKMKPTPKNPFGFGYGRLYFGGKRYLAHRLTWIANFGAIPEGMSVCHSCDVPNCVNPDHLFLGTQKENMLDCIVKNRKKHTLTYQQKVEICADGSTYKEIAARYGIPHHRVRAVKHWGRKRGLPWMLGSRKLAGNSAERQDGMPGMP